MIVDIIIVSIIIEAIAVAFAAICLMIEKIVRRLRK